MICFISALPFAVFYTNLFRHFSYHLHYEIISSIELIFYTIYYHARHQLQQLSVGGPFVRKTFVLTP